jgi:hypothetical protein
LPIKHIVVLLSYLGGKCAQICGARIKELLLTLENNKLCLYRASKRAPLLTLKLAATHIAQLLAASRRRRLPNKANTMQEKSHH